MCVTACTAVCSTGVGSGNVCVCVCVCVCLAGLCVWLVCVRQNECVCGRVFECESRGESRFLGRGYKSFAVLAETTEMIFLRQEVTSGLLLEASV